MSGYMLMSTVSSMAGSRSFFKLIYFLFKDNCFTEFSCFLSIPQHETADLLKFIYKPFSYRFILKVLYVFIQIVKLFVLAL